MRISIKRSVNLILLLDSLFSRELLELAPNPTLHNETESFIDIDDAVNLTSESHDSIARMNHLRKRKKEKT